MLATVLVALVASSGLTVTTAAPTGVTSTSAVLHGSVDPAGGKTRYWFEYGTTTAYGTATQPASSGSKGKVASPVTASTGSRPARATTSAWSRRTTTTRLSTART